MSSVLDHIQKYLDDPEEVLHELIPTSKLHLDLHLIKPGEGRPFYTIVTEGMSSQAMAVPMELEGKVSPYMELMLCLPADWRVDALGKPEWNWPFKWLRFLATYPHEYRTWLYAGHTIPNDDPPQPFAPNTEQCCWFVRPPSTVPEDFLELEEDDRTVLFLSLTAIYANEMAFALSREPETRFELNQALETAGVSEIVDPGREPLMLL